MASNDSAAFAALGNKVTDFAGFDVFPTPSGVTSVVFTSDEVTAVCPVTGQPDQYTVRVMYQPDATCLESKTIKLYFQQFRNAGIFCEAFGAQIARDVSDALGGVFVSVHIVQKSRGGVSLEAYATVGDRS